MTSTDFFYTSSSSDEEEEICMAIHRRNIRQRVNIFEIPDSMFTRTFRVNKMAFKYILDKISPKLKRGVQKTAITPTIKLATTLRFFAQGSDQLSVGNDFNLSMAQPTVSKIISEVLKAMEGTICKDWVVFCMTAEEVTECKQHFYEKTGFPGVIGCVDGTHIRMIAPAKNLQHLYYNRKGFFSINAMIICDHKMRIRYVDARHPGSGHDSLIWNTSHVRRILQEKHNAGERNAWILGDAGYPLEPFLMTPYRSASEGSPESKFNSVHAKARNIVERVIGVLKSRFRCLLGARELHYDSEKTTQIVNACAAIHNICIYHNAILPNEEISTVSEGAQDFQDAGINNCTEAVRVRDSLLLSNVFI